VLTREGDPLFQSYRGTEYLGAQDPLDKFAALLADMDGSAGPHPDNHRLAVARHVRAAGAGDRAPGPYLVTISANRQRALGVPRLMARVTIDAKGHVAAAEFSPPLGAAVEEMLQREAEHWLFLPAVKAGRAQQALIELPLELTKS
jgi:hypothetical protein